MVSGGPSSWCAVWPGVEMDGTCRLLHRRGTFIPLIVTRHPGGTLLTDAMTLTHRYSVYHFLSVPSTWHRIESLQTWQCCPHVLLGIEDIAAFFYSEATFEVCLYSFPLSLPPSLSLFLCGLSPRLCGLMSELPWLGNLLGSWARLPGLYLGSAHPRWLQASLSLFSLEFPWLWPQDDQSPCHREISWVWTVVASCDRPSLVPGAWARLHLTSYCCCPFCGSLAMAMGAL